MKKVKVSIALAVDPDGEWNCCGWSGENADPDEQMALAVDAVGDGEARYWVVAEVPIPEAKEIKAKKVWRQLDKDRDEAD